jgi:cobalt/nickel transport system permease protein
MRHDFIDRYSRLKSPIHDLPSELKLFSTMIIIIATVVVPGNYYFYFLSVTLFLSIIILISTISIGFIFKRLILMEPFVIGIAILSIFQDGGWFVFVKILLKSTVCLLSIIVFSNTTTFNNLVRLLRKLRVPKVLVDVIALMYRYIFVLIDEAEKMQRARASRTFINQKKLSWKLQGSIIGQLFVRSYERGERIYRAMRARGFS